MTIKMTIMTRIMTIIIICMTIIVDLKYIKGIHHS